MSRYLKRRRYLLVLFVIAILILLSVVAYRYQALHGDIYVPGFSKTLLTEGPSLKRESVYGELHGDFTLITDYNYPQIVSQSQYEIEVLMHEIHTRGFDRQTMLKYISDYFAGRPYNAIGARGEGSWCSNLDGRLGCPHIQQDPVYRTDQFDCQTLVEVIVALLHAHNIHEFNRDILKVGYGAAGLKQDVLHYYNRNNFVSADFNPVNEKQGYLRDVTDTGYFKGKTKNTSAVIDPQSWFKRQARPKYLPLNVRVLSVQNGSSMARRLSQVYPERILPHNLLLQSHKVSINYIPKSLLVKQSKRNGKTAYTGNYTVTRNLPTPSVIEIVRNVKDWKVGKRNIQEIIGSGLNVSHLGVAYRQTFKRGETIYQAIQCRMMVGVKHCQVTPVQCRHKTCQRVMFLNASNAYPNGYFWYKDSHGHYQCKRRKPAKGVKHSFCNRVLAIPLADYFTQQQYGHYVYLERASILGIHVEKIQ